MSVTFIVTGWRPNSASHVSVQRTAASMREAFEKAERAAAAMERTTFCLTHIRVRGEV